MIDIDEGLPGEEPIKGTLLTLAQAARLLPTRPAPSTLWRWAKRGIRGIHLGYRRLGGKIVVTEEAIRCFMDQLTKQDDEAATQTRPREGLPPSEFRPLSKAHVEAELRREGLL